MTARGANGARATTPRLNPEVRLGLMATHPNFTRSFASVFLALAVLVLNPGPTAAAPLPAELTAGLDRTTASGDRAAFTAALIEALGRSPGNARTIVIYAGRVAPAYTTAAASAAIQAFPGLRDEIMAGMAAVGPEHIETTRQLTQAPILTDAADPYARPSAPAQEPTTPGPALRDFEIVLGMGLGLEPDYEGHNQHEIFFLPLIDIE